VAAEDDGARAGGPFVQEPAVVGVVGKRPRVQGLAAGAQTVVRAGVGPGDEAVEETEMSAMIRVMPGQTRSAAQTHRSRMKRVADANSIARREETFQAGKGLAGLGEHQLRRFTSWSRWVTLAMLAHAFLAVIRADEHTRHPPHSTG
jgi:hypothetical protein